MWKQRVLIALGIVVAALLAVGGISWWRTRVPTGTDVAITISDRPSGIVWTDEARHHAWCLAPGETFPKPTGRWDDGVMHAGWTTNGRLHFDSDDSATFFGDLDGNSHPVRLARITKDTGGRCPR